MVGARSSFLSVFPRAILTRRRLGGHDITLISLLDWVCHPAALSAEVNCDLSSMGGIRSSIYGISHIAPLRASLNDRRLLSRSFPFVSLIRTTRKQWESCIRFA
ncbi:hypothetical protein LZ31DRAFT_550099 [Colletotrichum somersetense]|nr:hypothetical protein LZ31DRAFT_550099 [Colletotrichum somersetense]